MLVNSTLRILRDLIHPSLITAHSTRTMLFVLLPSPPNLYRLDHIRKLRDLRVPIPRRHRTLRMQLLKVLIRHRYPHTPRFLIPRTRLPLALLPRTAMSLRIHTADLCFRFCSPETLSHQGVFVDCLLGGLSDEFRGCSLGGDLQRIWCFRVAIIELYAVLFV